MYYEVGSINDDVQKFLKVRLILGSDKNYPKDVLHMYTENKRAMEKNKTLVIDLPGEIYTIKAGIEY